GVDHRQVAPAIRNLTIDGANDTGVNNDVRIRQQPLAVENARVPDDKAGACRFAAHRTGGDHNESPCEREQHTLAIHHRASSACGSLAPQAADWELMRYAARTSQLRKSSRTPSQSARQTITSVPEDSCRHFRIPQQCFGE